MEIGKFSFPTQRVPTFERGSVLNLWNSTVFTSGLVCPGDLLHSSVDLNRWLRYLASLPIFLVFLYVHLPKSDVFFAFILEESLNGKCFAFWFDQNAFYVFIYNIKSPPLAISFLPLPVLSKAVLLHEARSFNHCAADETQKLKIVKWKLFNYIMMGDWIVSDTPHQQRVHTAC